jgi:hypothetical protein
VPGVPDAATDVPGGNGGAVVMMWLARAAYPYAYGPDNWQDPDGSWWCIDVDHDGTAYTYCATNGGGISEDELPEARS